MKLSGVSILENRRENFKLNALFVVVLVLESKVLYLQGIRCIVYDITIVRPYEYDKREIPLIPWVPEAFHARFPVSVKS